MLVYCMKGLKGWETEVDEICLQFWESVSSSESSKMSSSSASSRASRLLRPILTGLKGTLAVAAVPTAHTCFRLLTSEVEELDTDPLWSVPEPERLEAVARRSSLVASVTSASLLQGEAAWRLLEERCRDDVEVEDPTARIVGKDNVGVVLVKASKILGPGHVESLDQIIHFQDKVVIDWQPAFELQKPSFLKGTRVSWPARLQVHLEKRSSEAGDVEERIWRIEDQWFRKALLTPETVFPSLLGSAYSVAKRAVGFVYVALAKVA